MPNIIRITDFNAPELDIYARLTEAQLLNRRPDPRKPLSACLFLVLRGLKRTFQHILLFRKRLLFRHGCRFAAMDKLFPDQFRLFAQFQQVEPMIIRRSGLTCRKAFRVFSARAFHFSGSTSRTSLRSSKATSFLSA